MTTAPTGPLTDVELLIGGMTCASCAARIEKKLNKLDGVTATVNYSTEKAKVSVTGDVTTDDLIATVEKTGYTADAPRAAAGRAGATDEAADPTRALRTRLVVSRAAQRCRWSRWRWCRPGSSSTGSGSR